MLYGDNDIPFYFYSNITVTTVELKQVLDALCPIRRTRGRINDYKFQLCTKEWQSARRALPYK